ncbi:PREDICTED: phospholipase A2 inhibitor and Ly6/PLAUR domain-containing protein-like [Thamnophis sirtalis]|uniref:Phospholipase A2 inhibitor and Ly6/PLAUR domain-containing protein-like n=1 Tax=Thamnophis sirtalis TaxID=35019 RepID=A0A6I9Z7H6_9SAUR|nr:PREDICTED: phospholipase A2 inhibitor and Ly6/PLAUR domain-containing protein-like [Thamnophis sirtalis]
MRAAGILVLCLFSSILSTVTSLKCQTCFSPVNDCEGDNVKVEECKEDEEFCYTQVYNTTITNGSMSLIMKECSKRELCYEGFFSTTIIEGRFEIARGNCCQTDLCNAEPLPKLEKYEEFQPNGLLCPGCFAQDEDSCEANQSVPCVGQEDQCVNLSFIIESYDHSTEKLTYQGCTTKNSCSFPLGAFEIASGLIQFNVTTLECRNAASSEPDHQ